MVCAAMIPNLALKDLYYHGKLMPNEAQFAGQMRRWIYLTRRRVVALFQRDLLWTGLEIGFRKPTSRGRRMKADLT